MATPVQGGHDRCVRCAVLLSGLELAQFDTSARRAFVQTMEDHMALASGTADRAVAVVAVWEEAGQVVVQFDVVPPARGWLC